jgi:hypothetical protein
LPDESFVVMGAWVLAAWLAHKWDRFPNLAITSPLYRCAKTRLLELLKLVCPNPFGTANISPAAIYRLIQASDPLPTLLLDEAQSLSRLASETAELTRELLNAGIEADAKAFRCGGHKMQDVESFSLYCPKIIALIGSLDRVLADRSLPIRMERKGKDEWVHKLRYREAKKRAAEIVESIQQWTAEVGNANGEVDAVSPAEACYDVAEPFDLSNDRIADLLLPLQVVLRLLNSTESEKVLQQYAERIDKEEDDIDRMGVDVKLLWSCREVFQYTKAPYLPTETLLKLLYQRPDEPWARYSKTGEPITAIELATFFRAFGVKPGRSKDQRSRGYWRSAFEDAWTRYLQNFPSSRASSGNPSTPSKAPSSHAFRETPSTPSSASSRNGTSPKGGAL